MSSQLVSELLRNAKRPLLHFGQGVRNACADRQWIEFAHDKNIPFVTARNANDIVDSADPLYIGRPGTFAQRGANFALQLCDLYLAVGTRLSITQTGYNTKDYARNAKIVQVNIDKPELEKGTLRDPLNIHADAREFLAELQRELQKVSLPDWSVWVQRCQYLRDKYPVCLPEYKDEKDYVNSYYFIDQLSGMSSADDIIVTDMGFSYQNTHQGWRTKKGQRLITNCGLAPMGWGLPAAIGSAFASYKRVICITGEGGLMMNIQELATMMHHNLNIKIFMLNNGGYLTIKQTQEFGFEKRLMGVNKDTGLSFPRFKDICNAHQIWHIKIANHDHFHRFKMGMDITGPVMFEVMMDPDQPQAPRFLNRRNPDGTMNPTKLEDAWPFLPPEEIEEAMSTDFWIETELPTRWRYK